MTTGFERLGPAVARILTPDGEVVGAGFLIAPDTVCTCAHVVARAAGTQGAEPQDTVGIDFPLGESATVHRATVVTWRPATADGDADAALLRLPAALPAGSVPVRLVGGDDVWDHRFRVLGFPAGSDQGVWANGRVRAPVGGRWTALSEEYDRIRRISPGFSGAPVWDEDLGGVIGMLVAAERGTGESVAYLVPAAELVGLRPGLQGCPYRGLEPFREEDADLFHGREEDIARITASVHDHALVTVVGASGSGKSSLVRAGVLPALHAEGFTTTVFRPIRGTRPVRALVRTLAAEAGTDPTRAAAADDPAEEASLLTEDLLDHGGERGHVLFLDQFEEVAATDPDAARRLLALATAMIRAVRPTDRRLLRVIATVRHGSLDGLVAADTARLLSEGTEIIAPLDRDSLLRAITEPVTRAPGIGFEPGLPERIVDEAVDEPGSLPLVQFALTRLWEERRHSVLTHEAYEALGKVGGALSAYAELSVARALDEVGEDTLRRLLAQLARPDERFDFVRVPVRVDGLDPGLRDAAYELGRSRLVLFNRTPAGEEIVDLAHEALVRQWPRARDWLEESREFRVWQEQLRTAMGVWRDNGRDAGALLRGALLERALEWRERRASDIGEEELQFIEQSRHWRRRGVRRLRVVTAGIAVLGLLAAGLAVWGLRTSADRNEANRDLRRELAGQVSEVLGARAGEWAQGAPSTAVQWAEAAWHSAPTPAAQQALLDQYMATRSTQRIDPGRWPDGVRSVTAAADGSVIAVLDAKKESTLTLCGDGLPTCVSNPGFASVLRQRDGVALSDDGKLLALASADGRLALWRLTPGGHGEPVRLRGAQAFSDNDVTERKTVSLDFSADGRRLLEVSGATFDDNDYNHVVVRMWDTAVRGRLPVAAASARGVMGASVLTDDGRLIVTEDSDLRRGESGGVVVIRPGDGRAWGPDFVDGGVLDRDGRLTTLSDADDKIMRKTFETGSGHWSPWRTVRAMHSEEFILNYESLDATGRFLMGEEWLAGPVDGRVLIDTKTGLTYETLLPSGVGDSVPEGVRWAVAAGGRGSLTLSVVVGRDLWSVRATRREETLLESRPGSPPSSESRYQNGRDRVMWSDGTFVFEDRQTGRRTKVTLPEERDWTLMFAEERRMALVWSEDAFVLLHPADLRGPHRPVSLHGAHILDAGTLPGGRFLLLTDKGALLVDADGHARRLVHDPCMSGTAAAQEPTCFDVEGRPGHPDQVVVQKYDGSVLLWDIVKGARLRSWRVTGTDQSRGGAVFSRNGELLAVLGGRGDVHLWSLGAVGRGVGTHEVQAHALHHLVALSDDGTLVGQDANRSGVQGSIRWLGLVQERALATWDWDAGDSEQLIARAEARGGNIALTSGHTIVSIPVRPEDWFRALCRIQHRPFTSTELRSLPAGAPTTPPCTP
ncbi:trypsin-like peptidase domain-containing protein [Streptomyces sp. NPDC001401]|uniref:nSTAND1 domain-containing NTPase n=1 Tax=Streptomyces sp. NPDC001401 TaxID=3364570 RepID=UPI0036B2AA0B